MNSRQATLLTAIITEYIATAQPVGSQAIVSALGLDLSPATIRNEMAELEAEGYIFQPHISAGRVPTEKGYQYYIANSLVDKELAKRQQQVVQDSIAAFVAYEPNAVKMLARSLADISQAAIFVGFNELNVYYTGLSNLFSQPEFASHDVVRALSQVIDHLDVVMQRLYPTVDDDVKILIGSQNPFDRSCSTVVMRYRAGPVTGIIGILGPLRMDYQTNVQAMRYAQQLLQKF